MSDHQGATKDYVAVIDIGSNAVRLVIYDGLNRAPFKVHSERIVCNLGAGLAETGQLNAEAVRRALDSLRRFAGLIAAMKIENVYAVATAAMRDAKDGKSFIEKVQKETGLSIVIIDGEEEARLSALGVLANGFGGDGVIGDYGGGSLELIVVENGQVKHKASLPLGSHRLLAEKTHAAQVKTVETHLESVDFLKACKGLDFYAMGGAWRSMAKAHMQMSDYPLRLLDHYQMEGKKAADFAALIAGKNPEELEKMAGMPRGRAKDMAVAALAMEVLFMKIQPRHLVFSGTGLREGVLFDKLEAGARRQDSLIASCEKISGRGSRFGGTKELQLLYRWLAPLFDGQETGFSRLLKASCLLSDIAWFEHEEYQAEYAFRRVLVMPFYGADHEGRAFLALSQYARHRGKIHADIIGPVQKLLGRKMTALAVTAGQAQRLAYLLTGGALGLLSHTELEMTSKRLILRLRSPTDALNADVIGEALRGLAESLGLEAAIEA
jgi:exopolyphosphatase/guanosine-5'-triphosphate,3'-diphosphate pyrophosphatase